MGEVGGLVPVHRVPWIGAVDRVRRSVASIGSIGSAASAFSVGSAASLGSVMSAASRGSLMSSGQRGAVLGEEGHPEALWLTAGVLVAAASALAWEAR